MRFSSAETLVTLKMMAMVKTLKMMVLVKTMVMMKTLKMIVLVKMMVLGKAIALVKKIVVMKSMPALVSKEDGVFETEDDCGSEDGCAGENSRAKDLHICMTTDEREEKYENVDEEEDEDSSKSALIDQVWAYSTTGKYKDSCDKKKKRMIRKKAQRFTIIEGLLHYMIMKKEVYSFARVSICI